MNKKKWGKKKNNDIVICQFCHENIFIHNLSEICLHTIFLYLIS